MMDKTADGCKEVRTKCASILPEGLSADGAALSQGGSDESPLGAPGAPSSRRFPSITAPVFPKIPLRIRSASLRQRRGISQIVNRKS